MTDTNALTTGWFADLPADLQAMLRGRARVVSHRAGEILYRVGETQGDLCGIVTGSVRMHMAMNEHEQRLVHVGGPGFWFGDYELLSGAPRVMGIEVATPARLICLSRRDVDRIATQVPDIWRHLAALSAQHLATALGAADDLMLSAPAKRLAAVLLRFGGHRLTHPTIVPLVDLVVTQQELAEAANMSRATAGAILRQMEETGEIVLSYRNVAICDPAALAARMT